MQDCLSSSALAAFGRVIVGTGSVSMAVGLLVVEKEDLEINYYVQNFLTAPGHSMIVLTQDGSVVVVFVVFCL